MTHHLVMHNVINELSAYIFTAGLAFNMAKYQPVYPPRRGLFIACEVSHVAQPKLAAFWTFWILGLAGVLVCCNGAQCKFMLCFGPRREPM